MKEAVTGIEKQFTSVVVVGVGMIKVSLFGLFGAFCAMKCVSLPLLPMFASLCFWQTSALCPLPSGNQPIPHLSNIAPSMRRCGCLSLTLFFNECWGTQPRRRVPWEMLQQQAAHRVLRLHPPPLLRSFLSDDVRPGTCVSQSLMFALLLLISPCLLLNVDLAVRGARTDNPMLLLQAMLPLRGQSH